MTKKKHLISWRASYLSLALSLMSASASATTALCQGLTEAMPNSLRTVRASAPPPQGEYWVDPAFGSTLLRITDMRDGALAKPAYSTLQAWNADESLLLLYHSDSQTKRYSHELYDGSSYQHLRTLELDPVDIEGIYWDPQRPAIAYYVAKSGAYRGHLLEYDVRRDTQRSLLDSKTVCGQTAMMTNGEGTMMQAIDQPLISLRCNQSPRDTAFVFNLHSRQVIYQRSIGSGTQWRGNITPTLAASGRYIWQDDWVTPLDQPTQLIPLTLGDNQAHASLGRDTQGRDRYYQVSHHSSSRSCQGSQDQGVGTLLSHDLATGRCRNLLPSSRWGYPVSGVHVSATAYNNPGWVVVSTLAYKQLDQVDQGKAVKPLVSEIMLVKDDADENEPTACRVAHTRSHGKYAKNTRYTPYFGEPHASLSPSGTRIIFGSDWHNSGKVNTYVIELPAYRALD